MKIQDSEITRIFSASTFVTYTKSVWSPKELGPNGVHIENVQSSYWYRSLD